MPEEAFLLPETAEQLLLKPLQTSAGPVPRVVALSYRWLSLQHPDPEGYQLGRLVPFLSAHLGCFFGEAAAKWTPGTSVPPRAINSMSELCGTSCRWHRRHGLGMSRNALTVVFSAINKVYGSAGSTITVQLTDTPSWRRFEEAVSGIIKSPSFLCDMSMFILDAANLDAANDRDRIVSSVTPMQIVTSHLPKPWDFNPRGSLQDFLVFTSKHAAGRKPVLHPDDMEAVLKSEAVTFTNGSDVDTVIEKYWVFLQICGRKGYCFELRGADGGRGGRRGRDIQEGEDGALVLRRSAHVQQVSDRISPMPQAYAWGTRPHRRKRADPGRCTCRHACFARSRLPLVEKPLDQQLL